MCRYDVDVKYDKNWNIDGIDIVFVSLYETHNVIQDSFHVNSLLYRIFFCSDCTLLRLFIKLVRWLGLTYYRVLNSVGGHIELFCFSTDFIEILNISYSCQTLYERVFFLLVYCYTQCITVCFRISVILNLIM